MNIALEMGSYCFYETILLSHMFGRGEEAGGYEYPFNLSLSLCIRVYSGDLGVWCCWKANTEGTDI